MNMNKINIIEQVTDITARKSTECIYPNCEKCMMYVLNSCTVPIVVTKQMYMILTETITQLKVRTDCMREDIATIMIHSPHVPKG